MQSCGVFFYNYRGYIDSDFIIPNISADSSLRFKAGQLIYRQSKKSELYTRFASATYDSLFFYGPDYHTLWFKLSENKDTTIIHFHYFGYNGWRGKPPHATFINSVRDSLGANFGAVEKVYKQFSNEKKK
jgi:hypothetical protein